MEFKNLNNYLNVNKNNELTIKPVLVDPGVKYFFKNILRECHTFKQNNNNIVYNLVMLLLFVGVLGIILYSRFKGNKSKEETYLKNQKDKQYIMSKLVYYNRQNIDNKQRSRNNMITNLPDYNNHPEASLLHRKIYF